MKNSKLTLEELRLWVLNDEGLYLWCRSEMGSTDKVQVVQMMGGLDKAVHYSGVAIVQYGAEAEAEILQMAASRTQATVLQILEPLQNLARLARQD